MSIGFQENFLDFEPRLVTCLREQNNNMYGYTTKYLYGLKGRTNHYGVHALYVGTLYEATALVVSRILQIK